MKKSNKQFLSHTSKEESLLYILENKNIWLNERGSLSTRELQDYFREIKDP